MLNLPFNLRWRRESGGGGGGGGGGWGAGVWGCPKEHLEVRVAASQKDRQQESDSSLTH